MGKTVEKVEEKLLKVVPAEFKVDVHHWLTLHGRYICIVRKPHCGSCIIQQSRHERTSNLWLWHIQSLEQSSKVAQPTQEHMTQDLAAYVKDYNLERLHSSNGDQSPIKYENFFRKVSSWT